MAEAGERGEAEVDRGQAVVRHVKTGELLAESPHHSVMVVSSLRGSVMLVSSLRWLTAEQVLEAAVPDSQRGEGVKLSQVAEVETGKVTVSDLHPGDAGPDQGNILPNIRMRRFCSKSLTCWQNIQSGPCIEHCQGLGGVEARALEVALTDTAAPVTQLCHAG